ncbi:hypothetical protein BN1051_00673 [Arthrobacter saudimassiliensis]|uniref:Sap, sulfolipid-1-addressing protein n=1 Tax=Arthrobacter saudimassiliensis TaxID=1461584 RepID=A0A078MR69_9MICC|nr:hypothetical protein BN1051_00673 [Arthrobacter saudimassiliensis]
MSITLLGVLALLALIDSTSFGTLLIPIWLMMAPGRLRPGRVLFFLGVVAAFYLVLGLALAGGLRLIPWQDGGFELRTLFEERPTALILLAAGAGLLAWSFQLESKAKREKAARRAAEVHAAGTRQVPGPAAPPASLPAAATPLPGRLGRWRQRAVGQAGSGGTGALAGLALAAAGLEAASMLPYLAGIGLITTSGIGWPLTGGILAGYCTVMVLPALLLLAARMLAARRMEPVLRRLDDWLTRNAANTLSWVVGALGVILIINSVDGAFNA